MNKVLCFLLLSIYACSYTSIYPSQSTIIDFDIISKQENCGKTKNQLANIITQTSDIEIHKDHINIKYNYDGTTELKFSNNQFISAKHSWRAFFSPYPALQYGSINLINCR